MTAWTTEETTEKLFIQCSGSKTDVTGISGVTLVNKIKDIAKANGISKFDVYDENGTVLSPSEIEEDDFDGDTLRIERYNTAA